MHYTSLLLVSFFRLGTSLPTADDASPHLFRRSFAIKDTKQRWKDSTVTWCLEGEDDDDVYEEFKEVQEKAWKLWSDKLKGKSSLQWKHDDDKKYCDKYDADDINVLRITLNYEDVGVADVGMWAGKTRHMTISISDDWGSGIPEVNLAHEMGHVFGLAHEHQRHLAWKKGSELLKFNCENLLKYDSAKKTHGEEKMKRLCSDWTAAADAKFDASEFLAYDDDSHYVEKGDFDWKSIMLYASHDMAKKNLLGMREKVLVKANGDEIEVNKEPSDGDIAALVQLYPKKD